MSTETPPELLNNDPEGFAWEVWHDRTPQLIRQIRDALPYGPAQRRALDALLAEIASGVIGPLGPDAHDRDVWAPWGADHYGKPWQDAPFLSSEAYFYRRLLGAVDFFAPGPWHWVDPFEHLKTAELRSPALEADLAALDATLPVGEQGRAKLLAALWGNRADLGFRIGRTAVDPASAGLVADDSARLWASLSPTADVILVADNAGREMVADLILIDHLLGNQLARSVSLHVKPRPYYVSDANTADVIACLRRLAEAGGLAAEISVRLWSAAADGRLTVDTHDFYCAPWSYHRMPPDLSAAFGRATLTIFKGDLNYRRLVGDRAWPATTPFSEVTAYFPGPVAALRTLKSDVVTGVDRATLAGLEGTRWRVDGTHGLIQLR
jgi:hypothetical protein